MVNIDTLIGTKLIDIDFNQTNNIISLTYRDLKNYSINTKDYLYITDKNNGRTCYTDYFEKLCIISKLLKTYTAYVKKQKAETLFEPNLSVVICKYSLKEANKALDFFGDRDYRDYLSLSSDKTDIKTYPVKDLKKSLLSALEDPAFTNYVIPKLYDPYYSKEAHHLHKYIIHKLELIEPFRITKSGEILVILKNEICNDISVVADFILNKSVKNPNFFNDIVEIELQVNKDFVIRSTGLDDYVFENKYGKLEEIIKKYKEYEFKNYKKYSLSIVNELLDVMDFSFEYNNYEIIKTHNKNKLKYNSKNKSVSFWLKRRGDN